MVPGSRESMDDILEAGYPLIVASRGAPKRNDVGASTRSNGYPFKRFPAVARLNGTQTDLLNGSDKDESAFDATKGSVQFLPRAKGVSARGTKLEGEVGSTKSKSCLCSILISVVICCFLAEALLQGSIMMLWKQTDLSLNIRSLKPAGLDDFEGPERYSLEYKLRFVPRIYNEQFLKQKRSAASLRMPKQDYLRAPSIALVCTDLVYGPDFLYLATIVKGLQALGYSFQLFAFEGGSMQTVWQGLGINVEMLHKNAAGGLNVDWSKFEGIVISSLNCKYALSSLMQEPFKASVVIWIILDDTLGKRLSFYKQSGLDHLILDWKHAFERANVVIFPDYISAMMHTLLDTGNFVVLPGYPAYVWDAKFHKEQDNRDKKRDVLGFGSEDIAIAVVGSPFTYKGVWREHAMIMEATRSVLSQMNKESKNNSFKLKLLFLSGNPAVSYGHVIQVMAQHLGFKNECVSYFNNEEDVNEILLASDIVLYSSLRDEQAFPDVLLRAMALQRFILAPNISIIQTYFLDGVGGLLYPAGDVKKLTEMLALALAMYKAVGPEAFSASSLHATQLILSNTIQGYAELLESILPFPSYTRLPKPMSELPNDLRLDWQWELLAEINQSDLEKRGKDTTHIVSLLEIQLNYSDNSSKQSRMDSMEDYGILTQADWEDEEIIRLADELERTEEEQIEERHELLRGSWEDIYKVVKKMERLKNELHERDDGELERIGQPICIYEPYFGAGAWPFLHQNNPLYRGLSLSSKQRRSGYDDVDATSRLPLLNSSYYQDILCEYGAFFAIANRIDRVHKNAWIGFQPWRAAGRKVALSMEAEDSLKDAIRVTKHGDAFYFWSDILDGNSNAQNEDLWSFCDMVNNNNCRSVFLDAFRQMYGLPSSWMSLPPMPVGGGKWSGLHSWALPTSSFVEFIMFARMFVDVLDAQHYMEHHDQGHCCLGISQSEIKHCYCKMLELLVNVWAYHSARRMIYVDPLTGAMWEQHALVTRQGHLWVKFFEYNTLKGMDEDLAEEVDDERPHGTARRFWPQSGEVFCQGVFERERREHYFQKLEKKRKNKERLERIRSRYRQKPLAGG